jgi:hypothetical protein
MGDGRCDEINNKPECQYDNGDCCLFDCTKNCEEKLKQGIRCQYKCGTTFYNCKDNSECRKCQNGKCLNINQCYKNDNAVKNSIENCLFNKFSMGNSRTIDYYCGKDPEMRNIHYSLDPVCYFYI